MSEKSRSILGLFECKIKNYAEFYLCFQSYHELSFVVLFGVWFTFSTIGCNEHCSEVEFGYSENQILGSQIPEGILWKLWKLWKVGNRVSVSSVHCVIQIEQRNLCIIKMVVKDKLQKCQLRNCQFLKCHNILRKTSLIKINSNNHQ